MTILLQQKKSGLYLNDSGIWTPHVTNAVDFVSSAKAIEYCIEHKIYDAQMVLRFEKEHYAIVMPMVDGRHQPSDRYAQSA